MTGAREILKTTLPEPVKRRLRKVERAFYRSDLGRFIFPKSYNYKHVIVHCGLPKTGSSYLQSVLSTNRETLAKHSIHYPRVAEKFSGNHSIVFVTFDGGEVSTHIPRRTSLASPCDTLLISAEGFPKAVNRQSDFLESFLALFPTADFRFVFYVRRFDHWAESIYSELVKRGFHDDITGVSVSMDIAAKIDPISQLVGKQNIVIRPYNRNVWHGGDLACDFCHAIDRPELWADIQAHASNPVNQSLTRSQIFALSLVKSDFLRRQVLSAISETPDIFPRGKARYFRSPDARRQFNERHEAANQNLVTDYGLPDLDTFLNLHSYEDDPDWTPFSPDWETVARGLAECSNYAPTNRLMTLPLLASPDISSG